MDNKVKIIKSTEDIADLVAGDQYIIQPEGLDYQKPETIIKLAPEIEKLQNAVEESIKKKIKKKIKKAEKA